MRLAGRLLAFTAAVALAACGVGERDDATDDALADVPPGPAVRDQRETGNCWLFTTVAWIERLETEARRRDDANAVAQPLAVAYYDYWDWYEKVTRGKIVGTDASDIAKNQLDTGGSWGAAVELVAKYGVVRRHDFHGARSESDATNDARLVKHAANVLAASLATGALHTKSAREDGARVRRELDRAFEVTVSASHALDDAFGADGARDFTHGASSSDFVRAAADVPVLTALADGSRVTQPLSELIGKRERGGNPDARDGTYAWSSVPFTATTTTAIRSYFKRIQRALNAGVPLPFAWYYPSNADPGEAGEFREVPAEPGDDADSVEHETLMVDYEATNVPGVGDLRAGVPATDAQKSAALDDAAQVRFLVAVDSYGAVSRGLKETTRLYADYLLGRFVSCPHGVTPPSSQCTKHRGLVEVTLPPGF